ncbi:hypothetical protein TGPRC2_243220 [Toxoplasma gondii TgCatPRC2]|uniref:Uncharacterized protein n=4 Tax=Toxoplasma gondii TaxID=5811 RepID=B6KFU1_TOXGV|nr:hypothetical protein TGME49_243220 [Toxoplasma gondii ME49]EPT30448.1 hypothetical protein TGME49_243220 [Toxoplasma gondii ME49]ESS31580.1 hypothetical protein TGVEG_243220 [Toxoplasma gondii VEG]KYF41080.1 hypothetical protein TGARI_243220 [Toxoplasma gondii ARI]KYK72145.1 hypothetical protein TGPRC2_243220 [Toxoplasma gondii TgCatPRC2]|eukprot:XP_002366822.1 hypothetical protein TGME49_243220 [Toxoplasma gondii ME49]
MSIVERKRKGDFTTQQGQLGRGHRRLCTVLLKGILSPKKRKGYLVNFSDGFTQRKDQPEKLYPVGEATVRTLSDSNASIFLWLVSRGAMPRIGGARRPAFESPEKSERQRKKSKQTVKQRETSPPITDSRKQKYHLEDSHGCIFKMGPLSAPRDEQKNGTYG